MNRLRKMTAILLAVVIIALMIPMGVISVNATSNMTLRQLQAKFPAGYYWNHIGSSSNNPDGYTSTPCNHHGSCDYYGACGCNSAGNSIQCFGFANKLAYDAYGSYYTSWSRTSLNNLKAGDVIRYKNDRHSIFVTGVDVDTIIYGDCNSDGHCKIRWDATISKSTVASSLTAVYSAPSELTIGDEPIIQHWYDNLSPVNLGDNFYAYIINTQAWRHLTNDSVNVSMKDETGEANQVWNFVRQGDGSYKIINTYDGNVLDCHNFGTTDGTNVAVCGSNDSSAQRWFVYGESGAYYLRATCGDLVVDIEGGATGSGTNVQMWTKNDTGAQKFQIWGLNKAGTTHVYCNEGTTFTPTTISWNSTSDTIYYDVKIWKGTVWEGDAYKILWGEQGTSCTVDLPEGYYEAYVDCRNKYSTTMSENVVKFTVSHGDPVTLGQVFTANITHYKGDYCVGVTDSGNVNLQNKNGSDYQKWVFELQNDNSYKITNVSSNKCLDVYNVQSENGTNIQVWQNHETDAQLFYIRQLDNGYALIPKCSLRSAVDIEGQVIKDGTNIQEWEFNGEDSQKFSIEYLSLSPDETLEFNGHRYEYYHLGTSWDQAYMICEKKGGHLVSVNSQEENTFVKNLSAKYDTYCWLGFTDLHQEGNWYWITGESVNYSNWNSGEPNNTNNCENYAYMFSNSGLWNDTSLYGSNQYTGFICEYEDNTESYSNYQPASTFKYNGVKYEVYDNSVDWQTANKICKYKGGKLADINTVGENEAIKSAIENRSFANEYWINATDIRSEGTWLTENGEPLEFVNWNDKEPNNSYNIENYAAILKSGKWNDMYGFNAYRVNIGFICKYEYLIGDTNLDGYITISDATALQCYLAELTEFTDEQLALADTNGDGEINISDATHLQMYLAEFDGIVLGKS